MSTKEIKVPQLGESVSEATIATWHKKPGDAVQIDEILVELETDKVTLEVNSPATGTLKEIKVNEGDTVEVGDLLGVVAEGAVAEQSQAKDEVKESSQVSAQETKSVPAKGDVPASPAARKLLAENNLSKEQVSGSGKDGRVMKGDVLQAASAASKAIPTEGREKRVKMSRLRQRIAERLKESQNTAAILTTFNEVDLTEIMNLRKAVQDDFVKKHEVKLGFMSFFVKAAVEALKEIPAVNAEINGDEIIYKNYYDIGVAVGTPQGLVVPVVRNADQLSLAGIEKEIIRLANKARDGGLSMEDMTGGSFTISNGGVYGSLLSTPIINPPQSGILGMHKTQERPMVVNGEMKIRPMMYTALSYDHRIIDGKEAVTFLVKLKNYIESPSRMLLEV